MAKRELIDRNNLESTTIVTDDFSGNEVLDVVLMEDVEEAPVITEQEIVKPYLDKIRAEIIEKFGNCNICEWFEDYDYEENDISEYRSVGDISDIIKIIDKYKAESEVKK